MFNDTVKFGSTTVYQTVGSAASLPDGTNLIPTDGIVGFSGLMVSNFEGASPYFHSLCDQGQLDQCRFGITLGDNGTGTQVLGALDKSLFEGRLTTTEIVYEWFMYADIALDDHIIAKNAPIELDTGTATIIGLVKCPLSL